MLEITLTIGVCRGRVSSDFVWGMLRLSAAGCWRRLVASVSAWSFWIEAGLAAQVARFTGIGARAVSGPADLSDPRRSRAGDRVWRPDSARRRTKAGQRRASMSPSTLTAPRRFCFTNERCCTRLTWLARPAARRAGWRWSRVIPTSSRPIRLGSATSSARWGRPWARIICGR